MGSTHKGPDGSDRYPADAWDIDSYRRAEATIASMRIPQFLQEGNPHDRLFVAGLDGTGNHLARDKPRGTHSVVGKLYEEIDALNRAGAKHIAAGYVPGTFTQTNPLLRWTDGPSGHSFEERVETAYWQFCRQAWEWMQEDPHAQIRIVGVGFSRGAEEVAALTRMVHERGIRNPDTATVDWNKRENIIDSIKYHGPPLVPPGQTLQAVLLFDPVSTGVAEHDRRLAPSVVSGLQITSQDDRRDQFKADLLMQPGVSGDRRFANVLVGGAHSDVGDTYSINGLGVLSYNAAVGWLNRIGDRPLLEERKQPGDPAMYAVHRSDRGLLWTTRGFRDGVRDTRDDLAPASACARGEPIVCRRMEATDPSLRLQAEGLTPQPFETPQEREMREFSRRMSRMIDAADRGDWNGFRQDQRALADSDQGRALTEHSRFTVDRWDAHERQLEQQRLAEIQAQQQAEQQAQEQQRSHGRGR